MFAYLEGTYDRISRVIDCMGYLLMLTLSLLLWWGIYSGVEITVSESRLLANSTAVTNDGKTQAESTPSVGIAPPSVAVDYDLDNANSLASGL